jgi:hypothetical protein
MNDDDRDMAPDPAHLLPYERELEPHDPNVERLPFKFVGNDPLWQSGDNLI